MFRLLTPNSQGLRNVLLRNVNKNHTGLKLAGPNGTVDLQKDYQIRNNSTLKSQDAFVKQKNYVLADQTAIGDANTFDQLLRSARHHRKQRSKVNEPLTRTIQSLSDMFKDDSIKEHLSSLNIGQYASLLNDAVFRNRFSRLSSHSNRDSDSYNSNNVNNDIMLKEAILNLMDNVSSGQIKGAIDPETVKNLLLSMCQYKAWPEIVNFWENGVNDENLSQLFLSEKILAAVLPVAFDEQRYSYDQIIKLYDTNVKDKNNVDPDLVVSIGKIALKSEDYTRSLDAMESLLKVYEADPTSLRVLKNLSELHLSFIGFSKDLNIATHFFNKVIEHELPYEAPLKAPHVASLLENLLANNESYETIYDVWRKTADFYTKDKFQQSAINSRYSILNNKFLSIFFQLHPSLTEESHSELKKLIATYSNVKDIDEYFLNTLISNYSWGDKTVFLQLLELYQIHDIASTPVSNRIVLKKMGDISDFTVRDIIDRWNRSLGHLDQAGYRYIPIADWAALRDCTILSRFGKERTDVYMAILAAYKDFHQDGKAVTRFVKTWLHSPLANTVARIVSEPESNFVCEESISIPEFKKLKKNVNYKKLAKELN